MASPSRVLDGGVGAVRAGNLFAPAPGSPTGELSDDLLVAFGSRIERIVSTGQATPPGQWYDQDHDEWVVLLSGGARLLLDGEPAARRLVAGDWVFTPSHCRHRVEGTDPDVVSVWLAVHLGENFGGTQ